MFVSVAAALQLSRQSVRKVPAWCNSTVGLNHAAAYELGKKSQPRHLVTDVNKLGLGIWKKVCIGQFWWQIIIIEDLKNHRTRGPRVYRRRSRQHPRLPAASSSTVRTAAASTTARSASCHNRFSSNRNHSSTADTSTTSLRGIL